MKLAPMIFAMFLTKTKKVNTKTNGYLEQVRNDLCGKWVIIDASKSAEEVLSETWEIIFKLLYKRR